MSKEMEVKRRANGQFKTSGNPKTQFKKGEVANPNGRRGSLADIINSMGDELQDNGKTKREQMVHKAFQMAHNGSISAMHYLSDRGEGKVKEIQEITHKDSLIIE
jgi:hypothetical protein|tara:strand:- start:762 stop:1076 length:315 start_codon:yes stop_codon:yes gene_type:complete